MSREKQEHISSISCKYKEREGNTEPADSFHPDIQMLPNRTVLVCAEIEENKGLRDSFCKPIYFSVFECIELEFYF